MGQKVNPHGLRVGVIKDWDSRWFTSKREFGDKPVSDELGRIMQERVNYVCKPGDTKRVPLMNGNDRVSCSVVCPIIAESDCVGALVLILPDSGAVATESEFKLCSTCATVLGMQMEG